MDMEQEMERLRNKNAALHKKLAAERKLWDECGAAQVRLTAERDEARAHYVAVCAERDALQAWKDAVPVESLKNCYASMTPSPVDEDAALDWLATLDGAQ